MIRLNLIKLSVLLFLAITVSACTSFGYYMDLMAGHAALLEQRKAVSDILADKETKPKLRKLLKKSQHIRNFASKSLHLPENDSYRYYVDLKRPFAVWNVVATKELSIKAKKWCFIFVGCLSYKGYFSKKEANENASRLKKQGYDVHVAGARAYSTLGWFDDPLLNTMMYRSEARRAGIIFHELAHHIIYIDNDSAFNEAFATVVEQEGVRRWMKATGQNEKYARYLFYKKRDGQINNLLLETKQALKKLYEASITDEQKRNKKKKLFSLMLQRYKALKKTWQGKHINTFDQWMQQGLNNSHLLLVATYHDLVPMFNAMLEKVNHDLPRFYIAVKQLGQMEKEQRLSLLQQTKK